MIELQVVLVLKTVGTDLVCFLSKNSELLDSSKTVCSENSENSWVVSITLSQSVTFGSLRS